MGQKDGTGYIKCPFTGQMVPRKVTAKSSPEVLTAETMSMEEELRAMRKAWQDAGPVKRSGAAGNKMMGDYRRLALKYWNVQGTHAPPIYSED